MSLARKRILFVDDEPAILRAFGNLLRKDRHRWDVAFADGGPQAVLELERGTFDVVITDMRMPELDGARLLEIVKARSPRTARIMLSGHAESESVLRALPMVHQFLSKPCDGKTLRLAIERCTGDSELPADKSIVGVIGKLPRLPSARLPYEALIRAVDDPSCTIAELVAIVQTDPAMCAKVLQIVNTPYFGTGQSITSLPHAISTLGLEMMREIARSTMIGPGDHDEDTLTELQETAVSVAQYARRAVADPKLVDTAYAAGLLHDIGRLLLTIELGSRYLEVVLRVKRTGEPLCDVERELLGVTHAEVGGHLMSLWALPQLFVEIATHHHDPRALPGTAHPVLVAVQAATD
jgi:HD-like signal output (HDOD) protein